MEIATRFLVTADFRCSVDDESTICERSEASFILVQVTCFWIFLYE